MSEKKNIILVTNGFYPEISPRSYRATELAREFCRQGHKVTVISKYRDFDYGDFLYEFPLTFRMYDKLRFPRIREFKKRPLSFISKALSRIMLTFFEYPGIEEMFKVRKILKYEKDYDLMISFAVPYPIHWGVAWSITKKHKISEVWVADCGDPYMGDVLDSFRHPFYFKYLEKWFCRRADFITIPVKSAITGYYPEFHHKIRIIPQGFDFNLKRVKSEEVQNEIPTFAYAGGFLKGIRDPEPLMKYLSGLDFPFRFLVFTNTPELLDPYREKLNGKLEVSGFIPREQLMKMLYGMSFLINFDNNTSLNVPSKLIDYALADRPVLNIKREFNSDEVKAFLEGDYRYRMSLPDPEHYHIRNISKLFLDLMSSNRLR